MYECCMCDKGVEKTGYNWLVNQIPKEQREGEETEEWVAGEAERKSAVILLAVTAKATEEQGKIGLFQPPQRS